MATNYRLVKSAEELRNAISSLTREPAIGLDTETTDLDPYTSRLRLIQLAGSNCVYIVDFDAFQSENLKQSEALEPLRQLLLSPRPIKIAHNAKFDAKFIKYNLGVDVVGLFDTLLASQLVGAGDIEERHGLETVASRYLNESVDKSERLSNWEFELSEAQLQYAARDAAVLLPLREKLIERLKSDSLIKAAQLEFECVSTVVDIELAGFYMHKDRWLEQLGIVEKRREELAEQLQQVLAQESNQGSLFGGPQREDINLDSHQQLTQALNRLGIPVPDSTRNWKLQPLAAQYPIIATLLEYRTVQKALTSYGQVEYRRCFSGYPEGRQLIIADYSQIELRILAEFSGDQGFMGAFNSGADLHKVTASQVFNASLEQVTKEQRDFAKRLNFGVVYGIGAQRFALMTGLTVPEAENVLRRYFATYRELDKYLREAADAAVRDRQARTASGRLVRFRYDDKDRQQISMTQRNGKNTPIQGTSADILKRALRLLKEELRDTSAQIVNIIHDEIVVEADAAEAPEIARKVERVMCAAGEEYLKRVPVKVETEIADEWVK
jgi:DNA polymerase I-like protein with 3'-5' exonuclease and polymerase domains